MHIDRRVVKLYKLKQNMPTLKHMFKLYNLKNVYIVVKHAKIKDKFLAYFRKLFM
jgi:hypothetical protein